MKIEKNDSLENLPLDVKTPVRGSGHVTRSSFMIMSRLG